MRSKPIAPVIADEQADQVIRNAGENDPLLRALVGLAYDQFVQDNYEALNESPTPEKRERAAARASAMMDFLLEVQRIRAEGQKQSKVASR